MAYSRRVPVPGSSRAILKGLVVVAWSTAALALGRLANQYISMGHRSPLTNHNRAATKLIPRPPTGRLVGQRAEWSYGSSSKLELLEIYDAPKKEEDEEDTQTGLAAMGVLLFAAGALLSIASYMSAGTPPDVGAIQDATQAVGGDFRTSVQPFVPLAVGANLTALSTTLANPKATTPDKVAEPAPVAAASLAATAKAAMAAATHAATPFPNTVPGKPRLVKLTAPATTKAPAAVPTATLGSTPAAAVPEPESPTVFAARTIKKQQAELRTLLLSEPPKRHRFA